MVGAVALKRQCLFGLSWWRRWRWGRDCMPTVGLMVGAVALKRQCLFGLSWWRRWRWLNGMPRIVSLISAISVERQLGVRTPWRWGWHRCDVMGLVAVVIMAPTRERERLRWLPLLWPGRRVKLVCLEIALMCCLMSLTFWPSSMCHNHVTRNHVPELTVVVKMHVSTVYQLHCAFVKAEVA